MHYIQPRRCAINNYKGKRTYTLLNLLDRLKANFGAKQAREKLSIINVLVRRDILDVNELERYHDILCFLRTYPDNANFMKIIESELEGFNKRIELYKIESGDIEAKWLLDSGIVNTEVSHTFSYELTVALSKWYDEHVEIDWDQYYQNENDTISAFLPMVVSWQENDTLDNDLTIDTREWLNLARSKADSSELGILLKMIQSSDINRVIQRYLFENAEIAARWTLTDCPASRTLKRVPFSKRYYQNKPIVGRTKDLRKRLKQKAPELNRLSIAEGKKYVRHIREILGARCRELYPLIHSDPREVYTYEPGRGVQLVVLGDIMDIRLPLECNFGAILIRNGMPIGYGIGCMLFDRVEIAINIFPAYRSGESSFIIEEFFKLFYAHFGARVLLVRSYQVGDDNNMEALESGSYWFYYKLGFRSVDKKVRELAEKEYENICTIKKYRSPLRMLRRLAKSDIFFHADPEKMDEFQEMSLINLGYRVTTLVRDNYLGDRKKAADKSVEYLKRALNTKSIKQWSGDEVISLVRLAPIISCIPDLKGWSRKERDDLVNIIRAKGSSSQRKYVLQCNRHSRFREALEKLAGVR